MENEEALQEQPPQEGKNGLSPIVKWVFLLCLAPFFTLLAELIIGICGEFWSISCTGILAASVGLAIACLADILATTHHKKSYYSLIIATLGAISLITFSGILFPEMRGTIKWPHILLTVLVAATNTFFCLRLTYIVDVKSI